MPCNTCQPPSSNCTPFDPCPPENYGGIFPSLVGPMGPPGGPGTYVENYALLRLLDPTVFTAGYVAWASGHSTTGDGGAGNFAYDPTSSESDNDGTVIRPSNGIGRWLRIYSGYLNVQWFGAPGKGIVNETVAVQAAIDFAKSLPLGAGVFFPTGTYNVTSLDMSKSAAVFTQTIALVGEGKLNTIIRGIQAGAIVIDCIGMNNGILSGFTIECSVGAQCGLLLARSTISTNCNGWQINDIVVQGSFTLASVISIASEVNNWSNFTFKNNNSNNKYCTFYTGNYNDIGVVSTHGTLLASSNTQNVMTAGTFAALFNNAWVAQFNAYAGYTFNGCQFTDGESTGGKLIVLTLHPSETVWSGPIAFNNCLFESKEATLIHMVGKNATISGFSFVTINGGYYNHYDNTAYDIVTTNQDFIATFVAIGVWDFRNVRFNPLGTKTFPIWVVEDSVIDISSAKSLGIVDIRGAQQTTTVKAATIKEATFVDCQNQSFGPVPPTTGTYAKGHFRWNTEPTTQADYGVLGFICVISGTPGTWRTKYSGAFSGNTASRPPPIAPVAGVTVGGPNIGFMYYDTTLGYPVFYAGGGVWHNGAGAVV